MAIKEKGTCCQCGQEKDRGQFYADNSGKTTINYFPFCKKCIKLNVYNQSTNYIIVDEVKIMLKKMGLPFIESVYNSALKDEKETFGIYIKNLNPYFKTNGRIEGYKEVYDVSKQDDINTTNENKKNMNIQSHDRKLNEISYTDEELDSLEDKWGFGYTQEEYYYFEKKWKKLIDNYGEKTTLHTEALITYIRFRVREEMATASGDIKSAKEWGALAAQAQKDGKLNVAQLSKSDISGGVDLVCQIFEAVESEVGIIPLLPKLIEQPYDDADMVIWSIINYGRRLEDKPMVQYRDIWGFYDEMLEENFKQQGLDENQIKEYKEKRNNVFRDLQAIYKEPVYEDNDD
jgi:hypothetical protein